MSESFFRRWSRRKAEQSQPDGSADGASPVPDPVSDKAADQPGLPSMEDIASLAPDSDYSVFLARGVDKGVRRAAMKKLFSDPHFSVMDGLDIYIDDYTKPSPLPPGMLAALQHAKSTLEPQPLYKARDEDDEENEKKEHGASGVPDEAPGTDLIDNPAVDEAGARLDAEAQAPAGGEEPLPSGPSPPQDASIHSKEIPSP